MCRKDASSASNMLFVLACSFLSRSSVQRNSEKQTLKKHSPQETPATKDVGQMEPHFSTVGGEHALIHIVYSKAERSVEASVSLHLRSKFKNCLFDNDAVCTVSAFRLRQRLQHVICENTCLWSWTMLSARVPNVALPCGCCCRPKFWRMQCLCLPLFLLVRLSTGFTFGDNCTIF